MAQEDGNADVLGSMNVIRSPPLKLHPAVSVPNGTTYFLSNLDQNLVVTMKTLYCFPSTDRRSGEDAAEVLRSSLQKVLTYFYPFDGRLAVGKDGKLVVLMDGSGVPFVEAEAEVELRQLGDFSLLFGQLLGEFVYCPPTQNPLEAPLLTIQLTKMKCGGFVLGMAMSHTIADGLSAVQFLHAWAEAARGLPLSLPPFLDRSLLLARRPPVVEFPHTEFADLAAAASVPKDFAAGDPILQRPFAFDSAKLSRLKRLASFGEGPPPSAFTALAGMVWRARTKALNTPAADPVKLLFAVDIRNRLEPPLPVGFFGNGIVFACCFTTAGDLLHRPLSHVVRMVQDAARDVTDRSIRSAIDYYEFTRSRPSLAGTLMLTDWTRLGFGTVDFGWGCPEQTGPTELPDRDVVLFVPACKIKGTLVLLGLPASAMRAFEKMLDF